jgi:hypothetical protein
MHWLLAGCSEKTGWKAVFFWPFAQSAIIFMSDLFQAHDFITQITISL